MYYIIHIVSIHAENNLTDVIEIQRTKLHKGIIYEIEQLIKNHKNLSDWTKLKISITKVP